MWVTIGHYRWAHATFALCQCHRWTWPPFCHNQTMMILLFSFHSLSIPLLKTYDYHFLQRTEEIAFPLCTHTHTAQHGTIRLITLLWFGSCRWRSIYCVQHGVCVWSNARVPRHFWVYYILLLLFERDTIHIRWAHGVSEWMANIHSFNVAVTNRSKLDR